MNMADSSKQKSAAPPTAPAKQSDLPRRLKTAAIGIPLALALLSSPISTALLVAFIVHGSFREYDAIKHDVLLRLFPRKGRELDPAETLPMPSQFISGALKPFGFNARIALVSLSVAFGALASSSGNLNGYLFSLWGSVMYYLLLKMRPAKKIPILDDLLLDEASEEEHQSQQQSSNDRKSTLRSRKNGPSSAAASSEEKKVAESEKEKEKVPTLRELVDLLFETFGVIYLPGFLCSSILLRNLSHGGFGFVFVCLAGNWICDAVALFAGRAFGKRKLAPRISPGKSVEGSAWGVAATTVFAVLVHIICHTCFSTHPASFAPLNVVQAAAMGLLIGVSSVVGDLWESYLKRVAQTKDAGSFFKGHGGFLDRCDGLFFVFPSLYFFVRLALGIQ